MNKDSFDKALQQKLSDQATDFDLEAAWDALEARRRRRRRVAGWWLLFFALVLTGSAGGWWLLTRTGIPSENYPVALIENPHRSDGDFTNSKKTNGTASQTQVVNSSQPALEVFDKPESSDRNAQYFSNKPDGVAKAISREISSDESKSSAADFSNQNLAETETLLIETDIKPGPDHTALGLLPLIQGQLLAPDRPLPMPSFVSNFEKKKKRRKSPNWWIGLHADYGLNLVSRTGDAGYVDQRNKEEETLDLIQAGLLVRRRLAGRWFVQSGIRYRQWTDVQRFSKEQTTMVPDSNLLLQQIIYADGSVENVHGPGEIKVVHRENGKHYNRYRHLEIPLTLGVAQPIGDRWQLEFSAGLSIGLLSSRSGSATVGQKTVALSDLPYRNAGTLSAQGGMAFLYRASPWSVGLSLTGRAGLNSSTTSAAPFSEKRNLVGLGVVLLRELR